MLLYVVMCTRLANTTQVGGEQKGMGSRAGGWEKGIAWGALSGMDASGWRLCVCTGDHCVAYVCVVYIACTHTHVSTQQEGEYTISEVQINSVVEVKEEAYKGR